MSDEDSGYDDACETIGEGLSYLFAAVGLDGDAYGDDAAAAYVISMALKRIAEALKPMGIIPDDDTNDLILPKPDGITMSRECAEFYRYKSRAIATELELIDIPAPVDRHLLAEERRNLEELEKALGD